MSVLRSHNNKTSGGLGRVCATGMYRSTEHVKFPKFNKTGILVEWIAPKIPTGPTGKSGPPQKVDQFFSKLFQLDQTDPLSFGPKFPQILVEWIAPKVYN